MAPLAVALARLTRLTIRDHPPPLSRIIYVDAPGALFVRTVLSQLSALQSLDCLQVLFGDAYLKATQQRELAAALGNLSSLRHLRLFDGLSCRAGGTAVAGMRMLTYLSMQLCDLTESADFTCSCSALQQLTALHTLHLYLVVSSVEQSKRACWDRAGPRLRTYLPRLKNSLKCLKIEFSKFAQTSLVEEVWASIGTLTQLTKLEAQITTGAPQSICSRLALLSHLEARFFSYATYSA